MIIPMSKANTNVDLRIVEKQTILVPDTALIDAYHKRDSI